MAMLLLLLLQPFVLLAQAAAMPDTIQKPPTLAEVRAAMGIPSQDLIMRGQRDTVGYASTAAQMEKVWELSDSLPHLATFGPNPGPGMAGILCPHDDYIYAGRAYRAVMPLITAPTVIVVGVFHAYRKFGIRDRLVFDPYETWRAPDGPVPVSDLRAEVLKRLPAEDYIQDAASHDSEHSVEAEVFWLRHLNPNVKILPILVPAASFDRLNDLADHLSAALGEVCTKRAWLLGRDVAVVISTDGVHYGADFNYTPYGTGGKEACDKAVNRDLGILRGMLAGPLQKEKTEAVYETFVDPRDPDQYRVTWCGRFSVPFGLLLLEKTARALGQGQFVMGYPVTYATSVGQPELPLREIGLGPTAPASLDHFVGQPAEAFDATR